ncbi:hypothetical protein JOB18_048046 [Solea senegalensis]|uniref:Uncharacterized protein n=1 Tax=Solea senegalensis TaxID=28829 RepID=A0AAV6Q1X1_SOLSE|nr:hypothetical protein JOB18_048046 [Solea senegalensis]
MLNSAAKASIPQGRRKSYIPCWDSECDAAFQAYNTASIKEKPSKSDHLMHMLEEKRQARWEEIVTSIDFTHSSRKAWSTINHLSGQSSKPKPCLVTANSITSVLVENGKWRDKNIDSKRHTYEVNRGIREATASQPASSGLSGPVTLEQLMDAILCLKNSKAPGIRAF